MARGGGDNAAKEFLRFSHKKTLILAHFFIEKGHAVPMDNAKIFPRLMSKSRGLLRVSDSDNAMTKKNAGGNAIVT